MIIFAPCRMMPCLLDRRADHEAGHVGEEQQRHVERVAELDEPGRLVGGVDEQHAALEHRSCSRRRRRLAVEPAEPDDDLPRPQRAGSRRSSRRRAAASMKRRMSKACRSLAGTSARRSTRLGVTRRRSLGGSPCQFDGRYDR